MRPIHLVVKAIKRQVPFDFTNRAALLDGLDHVLDSVPYTAPEVLHVRWAEIANVLQTYLGDPDYEEWKEVVALIFADEFDYRKYLGDEAS